MKTYLKLVLLAAGLILVCVLLIFRAQTPDEFQIETPSSAYAAALRYIIQSNTSMSVNVCLPDASEEQAQKLHDQLQAFWPNATILVRAGLALEYESTVGDARVHILTPRKLEKTFLRLDYECRGEGKSLGSASFDLKKSVEGWEVQRMANISVN